MQDKARGKVRSRKAISQGLRLIKIYLRRGRITVYVTKTRRRKDKFKTGSLNLGKYFRAHGKYLLVEKGDDLAVLADQVFAKIP